MTVRRPLPQPTLSSEPFWSSGKDGLLRIAQCQDCLTFMHPPQPICGECRAQHVEMTAVSGKAVVVALTVNHQQWLPSLPPPYVIAIVAIDEDPRARLMTNIVNIDPEQVAIGLRVRVRFEQHEEVWLPLFEPDPETAGELGPRRVAHHGVTAEVRGQGRHHGCRSVSGRAPPHG